MAFKVYLDGWEPQTRFPGAPANQCIISAMISAFNLPPRAASVITEGPFPKLVASVKQDLAWAQRGIKIIVEAGGTVHMVNDSKPYALWLDGFESGQSWTASQGLMEVFEMSEAEAERAVAGSFPRLLASNLTEEQASVGVRRLAMFGAFVRAVNDDLEPREIVWERLMRD
jgi:hypothetical protein